MKRSDVVGFYKRSASERWRVLRHIGGLAKEDVATLSNTGALTFSQVDRMIENAVGTMPIPLGIAVNFRINGRDRLIPMATEEPSLVAAASNAAKMARRRGGFTTSSSGPVMIGQVQIANLPNPEAARMMILQHREEILALANRDHPTLTRSGGGAKDVDARVISTARGAMVVTHLLVDCRDAMGANLVSAMAEAIGPQLTSWTGGKVYLRVVSNLAVERLARARATFAGESIGTDMAPGEDVIDGILEAFALAEADPFRAATNNKGIMNGIDSVVVATGNDWRAIEAGAHAYAALKPGGYRSLTTWEKSPEGDLVGTIELPMPLGLVGGVTAVHPTAKANVRLLGVRTAQELGEIAAAVGLAQNLAALRALVTEGIQQASTRLLAREQS